jgi:hypothetical protein
MRENTSDRVFCTWEFRITSICMNKYTTQRKTGFVAVFEILESLWIWMQVFKVFEKSLNCVKKRRKSLKVFKINSLVSTWLYDFLANKIDWLKSKVFANIDAKVHFKMWCAGTNYWVKMVLMLASFRQLIALKGLWKVFENRQKKSLKVSLNIFGLGDYESWKMFKLSIIQVCIRYTMGQLTACRATNI